MLVINYLACFEAKICVCDKIEDPMKMNSANQILFIYVSDFFYKNLNICKARIV
jgi:hypothetical protein